MAEGRTSVTSGVEWESKYGYSRAVRVGDRILVAGTTATGPDGLVGGDDAAAQARFALDKIATAIQQLGGRLEMWCAPGFTSRTSKTGRRSQRFTASASQRFDPRTPWSRRG